MNRILIGCINLLIFFDSILAQTTILPDTSETNIPPDNTKNIPVKINGVQLVKFKELRHGLRSGPIVIVNKNTFFVPNLHYDGKGPDAHFWVGNGTEPNENGILVPDETGFNESLKAYTGKNVYITLPEGQTTDSIEYFGLWCIKFKQNFGHVTIPKNIDVPPIVTDYNITEGNQFIVRIQKCCPMNQSMDHNKKCVEHNQQFAPNMKLDIQSNKKFIYAPFNNMVCTEQGKSLETVEGVTYFQNGTILKDATVWNQDEYCMETCNLNNQSNPIWKTVAIVCVSNGDVPNSSLILVSSLVFIKILISLI